MAEKEAIPPSYPSIMQENRPESSLKSKKWMYGVLFYAGAVTAALITLAVLGSIYLGKVEQACGQVKKPMSDETGTASSGNTKKYNYEDEEFEVDEEADKEIIKMTGDQYGKGSIVVHDFKKGVTGVYNARSDECYLIGGIDRRVPSARELSQQFESIEQSHWENATVHYGKNSDRRVEDLSLLPRELHDVCWGKDVYWLERMQESGPAEDKQGSRLKRATCPSGDVLVRYNTCYWFCCDFCIRYSNGYVQCYTCTYIGYNCNGK